LGQAALEPELLMAIEGAELWRIGAALLAGGGLTTIASTIWLARRGYIAQRVNRTVRILSDSHRAQIEKTLVAHGVPTSFCEIEWWNQGKRALTDVSVEVTIPGQILTWEALPVATDIGAGWECVLDPLAAAGAPPTIRIVQARLMPGCQTTLVIGFHSAAEAQPINVRGFLADRPMTPGSVPVSNLAGFITVGIVIAPPFVLGSILFDRAKAWLGPLGGTTSAPLGYRLLAVGGIFVACAILLALLAISADFFLPRGPSWNRAKRKRRPAG
jgi:hypothetical protein